MPRSIQLLVIHCTASGSGGSLSRQEGGRTITPVEIIDRWHQECGFTRHPDAHSQLNMSLASIGYHWVICTNGPRASDRTECEVDAHAQVANQNSIGIALESTDQFTGVQWAPLAEVMQMLCPQHSIPLQPADPRDRAACLY